MDDLYFCIKLNEVDHTNCEKELKEECERLGAKFHFWRKLVDGHVPLFREVKVTGTQHQVQEVNKFLVQKRWHNYLMRNPWK